MRESPFTLQFANARAEDAYKKSRVAYRIQNSRLTAIVVAVMWSAFAIIDIFVLPDLTHAALAVRLAGVAAALGLFAATLLKPPGRWIEGAAFAFLCFNILLVFALKLTIPPAADAQFQTLPLFMFVATASFVVTGATFTMGVAGALLSAIGYALIALVFKPEPIASFSYEFPFLLTSSAVAAISAYLLEKAERTSFLRREALSRAEEQIRALLHNVLPPSIAARKEAGEILIADDFEDITILFADIAGFTTRTEAMRSDAIVTMLNELFSRFDGIVAERRLEKIKTIGDCYMVAASVPDAHPDHARDIVDVALALRAEAAKVRYPDGQPVEIKIGIATGPATAGVIGQSKFLFDVWGDTVNTASRLENHALAGEILVTDALVKAAGSSFAFDGPHTIDLKGKGATPVWRLLQAA